jgi:hypothetical protein
MSAPKNSEKEYLRLCARVIKDEQPCDIRNKADYLLRRVRQLLRENAKLKANQRSNARESENLGKPITAT